MADHHAPGFLMVAGISDRPGSQPSLPDALRRAGGRVPTTRIVDGVELATWGLPGGRPTAGQPRPLSATVWSNLGRTEPGDIAEWLHSSATTPPRYMLPPFAAVGIDGSGLVVATDTMGFRQMFLREGAGWLALSTSARALAGLVDGPGLDRDGLLLQSLLGWQVDRRTIFADVVKVSPGARFRCGGGSSTADTVAAAPAGALSLSDATAAGADMLRSFLERYLDEHGEPVLQLTGGQDSRLVLSAIPVLRRKNVTVMTMGDPGTPDVDIAADLASRFGMRHIVHGLNDLDLLSPEESFVRACAAAGRLDCMADPIAKAATLWAEERFPQGPRLSGLGGEIARGFYYTGIVRDTPVTRKKAERLARWRMFANEAAETAALDPQFVAEARTSAHDRVYRALASSGLDWYRATDDLYLNHRMHRWAGLSESAVCFDRQIVNPMLDDRFRAIAASLTPRDKARGQFLARLQVALDPELAALPLDNRPPPVVLAGHDLAGRARHQMAMTARLIRKVGQRLTGARRPPAGGAVLAAKIAQHLRESPTIVDGVRGHGIFDDRWLDQVVAGSVKPAPSTLALLLNVLVAVG